MSIVRRRTTRMRFARAARPKSVRPWFGTNVTVEVLDLSITEGQKFAEILQVVLLPRLKAR